MVLLFRCRNNIGVRRDEMKKGVVVALLLVMLLSMTLLTGCGSSEEGEEETLVVAMELAYPPFETKDESGEPYGISVDLAMALGEYLGREVVIENTAWDGLIPSLQTGKADIVISSMTITEERGELVNFSDPYANSLLGLLVNSDSNISSIEDLNQVGKKVAVKTGSTGHTYAEENLDKAELIVLADESACVTEVSQGKADGFIYDQLTIYRNNQENLDTTEAIFIPFQDVEKWGIAVNKEEPELLEDINAFIKDYNADGGFDHLTEKHLSKEKEEFDKLGFKWFFDLD